MYSHPVKPSKTALIDTAHRLYSFQSLADLGGCWGVNGGYTFHAVDRMQLARAVIVDGKITKVTQTVASSRSQVELIQGALGDRRVAERVGHVDAIVMFDILLHQVAPNWDEFLELWAERCNHLIIYNQNWTQDDQTIRFVDRDVDWYIANVPSSSEEKIRDWYARHHEFNPALNRKWRDVYFFWQFGIVRSELMKKILDLGFRIDHEIDDGRWSNEYPWIVKQGLLASKV